MAVYFDRNAAQEEGSALIPDMPGYSSFREKPFAYMRTEQDQIWWLYWHFSTLATADDHEDLTERVEALEKGQQDLWDAIDEIRGELADLWRTIYFLATSALTYDVTKGAYTASMAQARREWQAQMFDGMTVADLATFTVADAKALNVRHVAVDGRAVYMELGAADPDMPWQDSYQTPDFNPDEFIRKSELTLIDTDNLEAHEIMGVLLRDADSDLVRPAPYARPYTTYDLDNSYVLFNDHVATDYPGRGVV